MRRNFFVGFELEEKRKKKFFSHKKAVELDETFYNKDYPAGPKK